MLTRKERQEIEKRKWELERRAICAQRNALVRAEKEIDEWTKLMRANAPRKGKWPSRADRLSLDGQ